MRSRLVTLALGLAGGLSIRRLGAVWAKDATERQLQEAILERLDRIDKRLAGPESPQAVRPSWADKDLLKRLFTKEEIEREVRRIAKQVSLDYQGKDLVVVGMLSGVFVFMADLVRAIEIPHEVQFIVASSYGDGTISSGNVKIKKDLDHSVVGRHVLLVDDICDSGSTLACVEALMRDRGAASVRSCVLLDKVSRRKVPMRPEYVGLVCPDEFVVGYGLDFRLKYRSLPYIGILKPEMYS